MSRKNTKVQIVNPSGSCAQISRKRADEFVAQQKAVYMGDGRLLFVSQAQRELNGRFVETPGRIYDWRGARVNPRRAAPGIHRS